MNKVSSLVVLLSVVSAFFENQPIWLKFFHIRGTIATVTLPVIVTVPYTYVYLLIITRRSLIVSSSMLSLLSYSQSSFDSLFVTCRYPWRRQREACGSHKGPWLADRVQGQWAATFETTAEVPWGKAESAVPSQVPHHPEARLLPVQEVQQKTREAYRLMRRNPEKQLTLGSETAFDVLCRVFVGTRQ